ncbi:hypothetical protein [Streptomyces sp. NPDC048565]|uniref:hypothetical protein n=1 Tax=Streptomyces sp. NPDC048565 TaxID=3155266 RepID=UPI0034352EC7
MTSTSPATNSAATARQRPYPGGTPPVRRLGTGDRGMELCIPRSSPWCRLSMPKEQP